MPTRIRWIDKNGIKPRHKGAIEAVEDKLAAAMVRRGLAELVHPEPAKAPPKPKDIPELDPPKPRPGYVGGKIPGRS